VREINMVKVIVVKRCVMGCPLCGNIHTANNQIIGNCQSGSTKPKGNVDISVQDPIPEWCPLTDIEWYGWKLDEE
jgi:hypothetical protein